MRKDKRLRTERLQLILSKDQLVTIDEFRFENRMPTRAAAIREILRRALTVAEKEEPPRRH
jgi:metal-responsive CopG/Arc/MetJ family transcriptional regulator